MPSVVTHPSQKVALSSCVGEAHDLRNPIFLSVAAQATLTRRADAKYGKRDILSRGIRMPVKRYLCRRKLV